MDTSVYYVFLFVHLISLVVGFGAVVIIDTFGFLWLLKKKSLVEVNQVAEVSQVLVWVGWVGLVISGTVMLMMKGSVSNLTLIKIFSVVMLGLNGIFLHLIKKSTQSLISTTQEIPAIIKFRIGLASAISQTGWWSAIIIGFLNRQVQPKYKGPDEPFVYMIAAIGLILVVGIAGEIILGKKKS